MVSGPSRVAPLRAARVADLAAAPLTYPQAGASLAVELPPGYHHLERSRVLGRGRGVWNVAVADLLAWQVQARAGLRVRAASDVVEGAVVELSAGLGPLAVRAPCRVVRVVHGDDVAGFAYGTLPGHPESGEESFVVRLGDDGRVTFTVRAFAVETTLPARASGRLGWWLQSWVTDRYLRSLGATPSPATR
ncbi:MAG: DUF1990 family protein [Angustibacter sp.]